MQCNAQIEVVRNDELDVSQVEEKYEGIIISPGPGTPANAGITMQLIDKYHTTKPIFGVCLGMQAIGEYFGATLHIASYPMHGKLSNIHFTTKHPLFEHIDEPMAVCRYHSLIINNTENTDLLPLAYTQQNELMALAHKHLPIWAVQFHPEAILTEQGLQLIRNWLTSLSLQNNKPIRV